MQCLVAENHSGYSLELVRMIKYDHLSFFASPFCMTKSEVAHYKTAHKKDCVNYAGSPSPAARTPKSRS
jgi:hypothetical protein